MLVPPEEEEKSLLGKLLAPLLSVFSSILGKLILNVVFIENIINVVFIEKIINVVYHYKGP